MTSDKNKLATGLANRSKPTIQRGQGVRLSTQAEHDEPETKTTQSIENAQTHKRTNALTDHNRINRGYKLREDLIKRCRLYAVNNQKKLYEVMDAALEEYLDNHENES